LNEPDQNQKPQSAPQPPGAGGQGRPWDRTLYLAATLLLVLIGCLGLLSCCLSIVPQPQRAAVAPGPPLEGEPIIQVRLAQGEKKLTVGADSRGEWHGKASEWRAPAEPGSVDITSTGTALSIGTLEVAETEVTFVPEGGVFKVGSRPFRGSLIVSADAAGALTAIEAVNLEDYVRGVVPMEVSWHWPREALMAQAVAARTFALHRFLALDGGRKFLTRADMAYEGVKGENANTDEAVRATQGLFLTYNGKAFPSFFHTCCGGGTSSVEVSFGDPPLEPLQGASCRWCDDCPFFRWTLRIKPADLAKKVAMPGIDIVRSIKLEGVDSAGRAKDIVLNDKLRMPVGEFRMAVGPNTVKSAIFDVTLSGAEWEFSGRGWGHGVGMCQWGARGMAREGNNWRQILDHYYPGSRVERITMQ
jgi:stage II sporulation protein D